MQSSDITRKVAREESPGWVKSHHVLSQYLSDKDGRRGGLLMAERLPQLGSRVQRAATAEKGHLQTWERVVRATHLWTAETRKNTSLLI